MTSGHSKERFMNESSNFICPQCYIGRCRPSQATYTFVHEESLVSVPDIPAYICDICGYQMFDDDALDSIWKMMGLDDEVAASQRQPDRPDSGLPG
jgi:YgiT-type zinc finger domain-containing protein